MVSQRFERHWRHIKLSLKPRLRKIMAVFLCELVVCILVAQLIQSYPIGYLPFVSSPQMSRLSKVVTG